MYGDVYNNKNKQLDRHGCVLSAENIEREEMTIQPVSEKGGVCNWLICSTIFLATGRTGKAAETTYNRLAPHISSKRNEAYSTVMGWIQCQIASLV